MVVEAGFPCFAVTIMCPEIIVNCMLQAEDSSPATKLPKLLPEG